MKKTSILAIMSLATLGLLSLLPTGGVRAEESANNSAFTEILQHYEAVRIGLLSDNMNGAVDHGLAIEGIVEQLGSEWSPERAGVNSDQAGNVHKLLPELSTAATQLAESEDLNGARDAFYSMSKLMVRFRAAATGDLPMVAYCPMAKRSWLQPEGEVGNPYYGESMPKCGDFVDG